MAFNSYLFIFVFLPLSLLIYYGISFSPLRRLRILTLILITLLFYSYAALKWIPVLLASIVLNYTFALIIEKSSPRIAKIALWIGVSANVLALIWFKYADFLVGNVDFLAGTNIPLPQIALPLAISFYTFQQISFLVDLSRRRMPLPGPLHYCAYTLFFPYILAGPITLAREIVPQFDARPRAAAVPSDLLVGTGLFAIGLFKKVVIADTLTLWVDPVYLHATTGGVGMVAAWTATIGYLFQIYFDFSGYSDMASGSARMLGFTLPLNFYAPLRSPTITEFWRRWHVTLGRFVQSYIFQPMAVPLTRWSIERDLGPRLELTLSNLLPIFFTMVILGAWHGANWTFFIFGAMHGCYMVVNEIWARVRKRRWRQALSGRGWKLTSIGLMTLAVIMAFVPFRASSVAAAGEIYAAMFGGGTAADPADWPYVTTLGGAPLYAMLLACFAIVYLMPTSQQIMQRGIPALEWPKWLKADRPPVRFAWAPNIGWSLALGAVFALGLVWLGRTTTNFVYFGF